MNDLPDRHAGNQCRIPLGSEFTHHVQIALGRFLEHRHGGFRPDQQVDALGTQAHVTVQRELCIKLRRVPLHALFDIALDRRDTQWCA
ncbi:hypothetical protein D3C80_1635330 [compost metagenome]